jgi:hypothetical protein
MDDAVVGGLQTVSGLFCDGGEFGGGVVCAAM